MQEPDYTINSLRKHRLLSAKTQKEVATFLGHKNSKRISKWERGRAFPDLISLIKLSILYGTLADELFYNLRSTLQQELEHKRNANPP